MRNFKEDFIMSNQTNLATVDTTNLFVLPDVQAPGDFPGVCG